MARHDTPSNPQELEELGAEAIVAQQTSAHLPQPRAQVTEEQRSVVIAEQPVAAAKPYRNDRGEKTIVIRDRRELDLARQKLVERQRRTPRARGVFYAVLALAVVAGIAVGIFGVAAWRGTTPRFMGALPLGGQRATASTPPASSAHIAPKDEPAPRAVRVDELPVERKQRR